MRNVTNYTTDKILKNIDAFIEGKPGQVSDIQPYGALINEYPFTSGKLKARIANKIVHPFVKLIKKAFSGYFWQKDRQFSMTQERLSEIEGRLEYIQTLIEGLAAADENFRHKKGK